ncbi:DUF4176 domain-containing protein [Escherichia coli]
MGQDLLPIGSVVLIEGVNQPLMIYGRKCLVWISTPAG